MGHIRINISSTCTVKPFYKLLTEKLFQYPVSYVFWSEKLYLEYSEVFITRWNVLWESYKQPEIVDLFLVSFVFGQAYLTSCCWARCCQGCLSDNYFHNHAVEKYFFSNSNNIRRQSIRFDGITNKNTWHCVKRKSDFDNRNSLSDSDNDLCGKIQKETLRNSRTRSVRIC